MVRFLGILIGLGFVGVAAWSLLWGVIAYIGDPPEETVEHHFHEEPRAISYSFEGPFGRYDRRQLQRGLRLFGGGADLVAQGLGDPLGADLLEIVDVAQHPGGVLQPDALVEPLGELAVVDAQHERRDGQPGQGVDHHERELHVVAERQRAVAHHVDVRLGELAGPALLGALAAPHLLDLVAAEREGEVPAVLHHVPGEGHGEVEVQRQLVVTALGGGGVLVLLQPGDDVDLLVDLALAQQLADRLDGAGLDRGEAVQLEALPQDVEDVQLDQTLLRKPFGETGQGGLAGHGDVLLGWIRRRDGWTAGPDGPDGSALILGIPARPAQSPARSGPGSAPVPCPAPRPARPEPRRARRGGTGGLPAAGAGGITTRLRLDGTAADGVAAEGAARRVALVLLPNGPNK